MEIETTADIPEADRRRDLDKVQRLFGLRVEGGGERRPRGYSLTIAQSPSPELREQAEKFLRALWSRPPQILQLKLDEEPSRVKDLSTILCKYDCFLLEIIEFNLGVHIAHQESEGELMISGSELDVVQAVSLLSDLCRELNSEIAGSSDQESAARRLFMSASLATPMKWPEFSHLPAPFLGSLGDLLREIVVRMRGFGESGDDKTLMARFGQPPASSTGVEAVHLPPPRALKRPLRPGYSGQIGGDVANENGEESEERMETEAKRASPDLFKPSTSAQLPLNRPIQARLIRGKPKPFDAFAGWRVVEQNEVLRPVVIDAMNVGMQAGKEQCVSVRGLMKVIQFFVERGHAVSAVIPDMYRPNKGRKLKYPIADREALEWLYRKDILICTDSALTKKGELLSLYDDLEIVRRAHDAGGIIISKDKYRDIFTRHTKYKKTCTELRVAPVWDGSGGVVWPLDGPQGRAGKSLDSVRVLRPSDRDWTAVYGEKGQGQLSRPAQTRLLYVLHVLLAAADEEARDRAFSEDAERARQPWSVARCRWVEQALAIETPEPREPAEMEVVEVEAEAEDEATREQRNKQKVLTDMGFEAALVQTVLRDNPDLNLDQLTEIILNK